MQTADPFHNRYSNPFEELNLKEALILSLGSVNVGYTYEEVLEILDVFSAIRPETLSYTSIKFVHIIKFIDKLKNLNLVTIRNSSPDGKRVVPTVKLSEEGMKEYYRLREKYRDTIVEDRLSSIRDYFGLAS